ncbi:hypothetical protein BD324DRAFT_630899 [Kockovaella imperatae]|uniref:Small ribosomal subunit protein bS18m n=1 Tax=Kockovaella imperatae TaxID=4999 RepID=A0A1Y1UC52_9TREE|nr:hypothetical protein BD324DRAFT_630899 [Kockovaella imperatae]ORX35628.1 hypothetical protein BD324DRAFT_630899 [Kockovaella imperatae]
MRFCFRPKSFILPVQSILQQLFKLFGHFVPLLSQQRPTMSQRLIPRAYSSLTAMSAASGSSFSSVMMIGGLRTFSSTSIPSRPPPNGFESFAGSLANILGSQAASSSSSNGSTPQTQTEAMLKDMGAAADGRRTNFHPGATISPSELTRERLFPGSFRPRRKPPLFGPQEGKARQRDPFILANSHPLEHTYNARLIQAFLDPMGRIKPRSETQLSKKSQKQVGKLVRRARSMGIISVWNNSPSKAGYGRMPSSGLSFDFEDDSLY